MDWRCWYVEFYKLYSLDLLAFIYYCFLFSFSFFMCESNWAGRKKPQWRKIELGIGRKWWVERQAEDGWNEKYKKPVVAQDQGGYFLSLAVYGDKVLLSVLISMLKGQFGSWFTHVHINQSVRDVCDFLTKFMQYLHLQSSLVLELVQVNGNC